jgi:Mg2+/Co2+ transporter CorB
MTSSQHISEEELRTIVNEAREKLTKLVNVLNKGEPRFGLESDG